MGQLAVNDGTTLAIEVTEPFTSRNAPLLGRPACMLDEGMLRGIIETHLNIACEVHETACTAAGDNLCRYEVAETAG